MFNIRRFDLIVALYIFCILIAELMGAKTFTLATIGSFNLNASVAIFVIPLLFTLSDVVVEVYGKERARSVVLSGLTVIALLIGFSLLATSLPPTDRFSPNEAAYDTIFHASARIATASLIAFAVAELLDILIFSKLRELLKKRALWLRNNVSNFVSQLADSTVFIFLAFYSLSLPFNDNFSFLIGLIIPYWLLKCAMSLLETPLVYAGVWWLKGEKNDSKRS